MSLWKVTRIQHAVMNDADYDLYAVDEEGADIEEFMNDMAWELSFIDFDTVDQYVEKVK